MSQKWAAILLAGFIGGVLLRSFLDTGWAFAAFFVLLGIVLFAVSRMAENRKLMASIAIFLITAGLGMARYEIKDTAPDLSRFESVAATGGKIELRGIVVDEPDEREKNTRLIVESEGVKILVYAQHYPEFKYGDELKISGKLKKPSSFAKPAYRTGRASEDKKISQSDFDWAGYLAKDDIYYEMLYPKINLVARGNGNWVKRQMFALKAKYLSALSKVIPEPYAAFMGGLTVGAKRAIGKNLLEDFRKTGIIHIVVLSGYNISLVADTFMRFASFLPRVFATSFGVLGIILFAIMTGASATVVRASLMALLVVLARTTGRIYEITWALFLTGFFMVLHNPKILRFDAGFQLSFLATFAIIFLAPHVEEKMTFMPKKFQLREIISATLATQIFVLPLLLYKMGMFSAVSIPVNLLVLIFVPATMLLGFITGALGMFSALLSVPFGWISYAFLRYELGVVEIFAKLPFASFNVPNFPLWLALAVYAIYAIIICRLNGKNKKTI
ncbi:MAG: ComEC family competence protein [bacterium]|nr:ComEC family competence protein [bacterium]